MASTWILIADASRARLLAADPQEGPVEVAAFAHPESRAPARASKSATLPRIRDRFGSARHAIEPRSQLKDVESARFARTLCGHLKQAQLQHQFERLVLVAPARFLGMLHAAMGKRLRATVIAEARKDLVAATHADLSAQLRKMSSSPPVE